MEYRIGLEWNCLFSVSSASLINFSLLIYFQFTIFSLLHCCVRLADRRFFSWSSVVATKGCFCLCRIVLHFFRPAPSPGNGTRRCILNENKTNHLCFWPIPLCTSGEAFHNSTSKCVTCLKTQTGNFSKPTAFLPFFMAPENGGEEITNLMPQMRFWQHLRSLPSMLTFIRKA